MQNELGFFKRKKKKRAPEFVAAPQSAKVTPIFRGTIKTGAPIPQTAPTETEAAPVKKKKKKGFGSKFQKLRKKVKAPVRKIKTKIHKATIPKQIREPLKKFERKNRKNIKKVGQAAAMAVATVFTGGAAAAGWAAAAKAAALKTAQSLAVDAAVGKAGKKYGKKKSKKEQKKIAAEIAQLEKEIAQSQMQNLPDAINQIPPEQQAMLRAGVAQHGEEWLKSPEALEMMRPAIVKQAAELSEDLSPNPLAKMAAAEVVDEQVTEAEEKAANKPLIIGAAVVGGLLLIALLKRKRS